MDDRRSGPALVTSADKRVGRTLALLQSALMELVEERDLADVSVAAVAEVAGVSRSTFYDYYRDVHELAEAACTSLIDGLVDSLPQPSEGFADQDGMHSLEAFFDNLAEHGGLYRTLLGPRGSALVTDHIRRRISDAVRADAHRVESAQIEPGGFVGSDEDIHAAFVAGALMGVASAWVQAGVPGSPAAIAATTWRLLTASSNFEVRESSDVQRDLPDA